MATGMAIDLCNKKKTNNAQTIKGNQAGTLHVWFPYSISLRVGGQSFDANAEGTAPLTTGKTGKGGMLDE